MESDRAGLQVLTRAEALGLLATANLGRIAISWRAMPMIMPVHFSLDAERIIVTTWDGSILAKATRGTVVAFEVEGPSPHGHPAWSVLVNGMATHLDDGSLAEGAPRWVPDRPARLVSISTDHVSGRQSPDGWQNVSSWPARTTTTQPI